MAKINVNEMKNKVVTYFEGVRSEWGKVLWPEKQQIVADFWWVVVICTFFTVLIFILDVGFDKILSFIPKY